jgi:hypothetical protein
MDRHVFLTAPYADDANVERILNVFYDINSGHYDCELDNRIVATITFRDNKWVDADTNETTEFSARVGALIDERTAAAG